MLLEDVVDREHNPTRFVVLAPGDPQVDEDDDKTSIVFEVHHHPGALALALSELGLRGANLTRIESRPSGEQWTYKFYVDLVHEPGAEGLAFRARGAEQCLGEAGALFEALGLGWDADGHEQAVV